MSDTNQLTPDAVPQAITPTPVKGVGLWPAFLAAVQFLTRVPLAVNTPILPAALHRCPIFFPLVGGLIGVATAATIALGCLVWPVWLAVIVALALEARMTGALHEDAVADFCDAFGGGWTHDEVLAILKDSRIGTYGALGLFLSISLRIVATTIIVLNNRTENVLVWGAVIISAASIARWVMVLAIVRVPPLPRPESLTRDVGHRLTGRDVVLASLGGIPFVAVFAYLQPLHFLAAVGLVSLGAWSFFRQVRKRIGGMTGDCLGCLGYVSQILVLLAAAMQIDLGSLFS